MNKCDNHRFLINKSSAKSFSVYVVNQNSTVFGKCKDKISASVKVNYFIFTSKDK